MKISGSISAGHVAVNHDLREGQKLPENIDLTLSKDNVILECNLKEKEVKCKDGTKRTEHESIEDWINRRMQPAIDAYDATQKPCRKISKKYGDYISWHNQCNKQNGKPIPLAHEWVIQIGEHYETKWNEETKKNEPLIDENGNPELSIGGIYYEANEEKRKEMREGYFIPEFRKILSHFKEKYQHMEIIQATIHFDEPNGTPHMHLTVVPVGENFKNGLQERVGFGHAIGNDGIERSKSRTEGYQMQRMYEEMHSFIKEVIKENENTKNFDLKDIVNHRRHEESDKYRSPAGKMKEQIDTLQSVIQTQNKQIKAQIQHKTEQAQKLNKTIADMAKSIAALAEQKNEFEEKEEELNKREQNINKEVNDAIKDRTESLDTREQELDSREREINRQKTTLREKAKSLRVKEKIIEAREKETDAKMEARYRAPLMAFIAKITGQEKHSIWQKFLNFLMSFRNKTRAEEEKAALAEVEKEMENEMENEDKDFIK